MSSASGSRPRDRPLPDPAEPAPELADPSGESFYQFYGRYAHRLQTLLAAAEASPNSIAVVTHVRNLPRPPPNIVLGGDRNKRSRSKVALTRARGSGDVTVKIPGADQQKLDAAAQAAKKGCPVSRVLNATITMDAKLVS